MERGPENGVHCQKYRCRCHPAGPQKGGLPKALAPGFKSPKNRVVRSLGEESENFRAMPERLFDERKVDVAGNEMARERMLEHLLRREPEDGGNHLEDA